MASAYKWVVLLIAAIAANQVSAKTRISGGLQTTIEEWPTVAQVETLSSGVFWTQSCGGHIVTNKYVITAAQCVSGLLMSVFRRVRVGTTVRGSGGEVYGVERVFNHPSYNGESNNWNGDISLIRLEDYIVYNEQTQRGPIVSENFYLPPNILVNILGWGRTSNSSLFRATNLRVTSVSTLTTDTCSEANDTNVFCATDIGADACEGDLGGPAYLDNILVGVISGTENCESSGARVYTNVSAFTAWITQTVSDNP